MNVASVTEQRHRPSAPGGAAVERQRARTARDADRLSFARRPTNVPGARETLHRPGQNAVARLAIVEPQLLFAQALEIALAKEGYDVHRQETCDRTVPGKLLAAGILQARPQIALLDLDLTDSVNTGQLIEPLIRAGIDVVVLAASMDPPRWGECLRYGACTVLPKSVPLETILATLQRIGGRLPVLDQVERDRLLAAFDLEQHRTGVMRRKLDLLTPRERQVLVHLMLGHPVREIARMSFVSETTVRTQVKSILAKLEVTSQLAAVGVAHQVEWRPFNAAIAP